MLGRNPATKNKGWFENDPEKSWKTACGKGHMLLGSQEDICGVEETEQEMLPETSNQGEGMEGVSH